jgi:hypothetical protein
MYSTPGCEHPIVRDLGQPQPVTLSRSLVPSHWSATIDPSLAGAASKVQLPRTAGESSHLATLKSQRQGAGLPSDAANAAKSIPLIMDIVPVSQRPSALTPRLPYR